MPDRELLPLWVEMMRLSVLLSCAVGVAACGADTSASKRAVAVPPSAPDARPLPSEAAVVPEISGDREIRRRLGHAIAAHPELKDRDISFVVENGDVNVSGVVRSESERKALNDLAMNIDGVKSVANGLRVNP